MLLVLSISVTTSTFKHIPLFILPTFISILPSFSTTISDSQESYSYFLKVTFGDCSRGRLMFVPRGCQPDGLFPNKTIKKCEYRQGPIHINWNWTYDMSQTILDKYRSVQTSIDHSRNSQNIIESFRKVFDIKCFILTQPYLPFCFSTGILQYNTALMLCTTAIKLCSTALWLYTQKVYKDLIFLSRQLFPPQTL